MLSDFPPLQSPNAIPNNLPSQLTSFIGRENELAELKRLIPSSHLLTLTGSGGTGKTRLSMQAAAEMFNTFRNGVWLVELAPLSDLALIAQTVDSVWGVREQPGYTIVSLLLDFLRARRLLIILDNCEHVVEACAQFADNLQRAAPEIKILATSREALGIAEEQAYPVPSLQLPGPKNPLPGEALAQSESIRLFIK